MSGMKRKTTNSIIAIMLVICMLAQFSVSVFAQAERPSDREYIPYDHQNRDYSPAQEYPGIVDDYSNHWAAEYIYYLISKGVIVGN